MQREPRARSQRRSRTPRGRLGLDAWRQELGRAPVAAAMPAPARAQEAWRLPGALPPAQLAALSGQGGRKVRLSTVLDQADDAEVTALEPGEVRDLAVYYRQVNMGVPAEPDEEASSEQLAALRARLAADVPPYADFAVFRPYAQRLTRNLKF